MSEAYNKYEEAKANAKRFTGKAEEARRNKAKSKDILKGYTSQKKNLEKRLEDVKNLIRRMDNIDSGKIMDANKASSKAGERYKGAIKCSHIQSKDLATAYYTKTVGDDENSGSAYKAFVNEKARLEKAIVELAALIKKTNNAIAAFDSSIRQYEASANAAGNAARRYLNQYHNGG